MDHSNSHWFHRSEILPDTRPQFAF